MVNDPRDRAAYRMGIALLGVAVAVALAGICWVAAEHQCVNNIPVQLWFMGGAVSGVFVGALIPFSRDPLVIVGVAVLAALCVAAAIVGLIDTQLAFDALAVTTGSVLLGLLIPSPGRRDP